MAGDTWRYGRGPATLNPVREIEEIGRRLEEDFFRPAMRAVLERIPERAKAWSPSVDVFEKGDNLEVKVELPGVKQTDINVSVSDDTLTITGERTPDTGIKDEDYHRSEITYGNFYRSMTLPARVDTKNIEAVYEDGMLRITMPRAAGAKPKKVSVLVKKGEARP